MKHINIWFSLIALVANLYIVCLLMSKNLYILAKKQRSYPDKFLRRFDIVV